MSEIKFACPNCQQHIQCGIGYAGLEIPCPTCQSKMTVPIPIGAPAPAPALAAAPAPALRTAAPPPPVPAAAPEAAGAEGPACPSCGNPVAPRAIMCVKCGANVRTGQKMTGPGGRPVGARPSAAALGPVPWYKNADVYSGIILAIMVLCYGSAWLNPLGSLAYLAFWLLVDVAAIIIVLVAAFRESVGTGFLTLCVPFYVFYFVYAKCESKLAKAMWSLAILGRVGMWLLPNHSGD
jgi:hypothetical protein